MSDITDNIVNFYTQQILPKLTVNLIYNKVNFTIRRGKYWRAPCPIHGGDNPTAFCINTETLAWSCFSHCGKGSVLAFVNGGIEPKGQQFIQVLHQLAQLVGINNSIFSTNKFLIKTHQNIAKNPTITKKLPLTFHQNTIQNNQISNSTSAQHPYKFDLSSTLKYYQEALPNSLGEQYLLWRNIPLEIAQAYGVGYAAFGKWLHKSRDWKWGRLVFPHQNPEGQIVNLYGRAVGSIEKVPKELRHDHLPGSKAYFNGQILKNNNQVFICEGSFDAISLIAAGYPNAIAIFGIHGWRWDWAYNTEKLIFALDADQAGEKWKDLARQACLRGKKVSFLTPESYGNKKDVNEAWIAGLLNVEI
jgi:DNA primase